MSRAGEVWDTGYRVFVVLEEDPANAYDDMSVCHILILYDDNGHAVGRTTGQWVPRYEGTICGIAGSRSWKQIASFQS